MTATNKSAMTRPGSVSMLSAFSLHEFEKERLEHFLRHVAVLAVAVAHYKQRGAVDSRKRLPPRSVLFLTQHAHACTYMCMYMLTCTCHM